jgi:hypothetical protein
VQLSQIPNKFQKAFASLAGGAYIRTIPVNTPDPDAASQELGFPPPTMAPVGAGGVPPDGRDMNGVLNNLSGWAIWQAAGGCFPPYDATFQGAVGGYPAQAIVGSLSVPGAFWRSTTDNNTTNPDTGGAGWTAFPGSSVPNWGSPGAIGNVTPNSGVFAGLSAVGNFFAGGTVFAGVDLQINGVGFSQSFGGTGTPFAAIARLPSGQIMQWGRFFSPSGSADAIVFPQRFPNNCALATAAAGSAAPPNAVNTNLNGDFSGFTAYTFAGSSIAAGIGVGWIAMGN